MANLEFESFPCIKINVPQWYADPEFWDWFITNKKDLATWHQYQPEPHDCSDCFITYDYGDGSNSDMPEKFWDQLSQTLGSGYYLVWLTNLAE